MPVEVVLPMLGITTERGKILKWHKKEGEKVKKGEILFEVETEKVVTEVESPASGILGKILVKEGIEVPVLTLVALIVQEGESLLPEAPGPKEENYVPAAAPIPSHSVHKHVSRFDVVVLGGGPGGYAVAIRASRKGARVLLVEKDDIGGTCLHRGCIPTKSYLSDVEILRKIHGSAVFDGISEVRLNPPNMLAKKDRVVKRLHKGLGGILKSLGVAVVKGSGSLLNPTTLKVQANESEELYEARNIVIATGSRPSSLPGVRPDGERILFSDHMIDLRVIPKSLLVVGGGAIGLEWASIMAALGTEVTVLEALPRLVWNGDEDLAMALEKALKVQGVRVLTRGQVEAIKTDGSSARVEFLEGGKNSSIEAEAVLLATGRVPNTEGIGLEEVGIVKAGPFIKVDEGMRTSIPGIYAVGDVIGKSMLAHAAFAEAMVAVENLFGGNSKMDYGKVPNCIYTLPEVAWVGLSEDKARAEGYRVKVAKYPLSSNGKALTKGEPEGFVKIVAEEELGQILGVFIMGSSATELLGECLLALRLEASVEEMAAVVKPHPSLSEAVAEAAMAWLGNPLHWVAR